MVYCTKCGTKNEEDAVVCVKCGEPLVTRPPWRRERWRAEKECFGLPGPVVGIVIGIMIILAGVLFVLQQTDVIEKGWNLTWPLIVITFGILFLAGALYRYSRRS